MDLQHVGRGPRQGGGAWWVPVTIVAGLVVVAALVVAVVLAPDEVDNDGSSVPLPSRVGLAARAALVVLGSDEKEFEAARAELLSVLDARRDRLPEGAHTTVSENLEVIEAQINAISEELERLPDDPRLTRLLADAYRQELELLQMAASLPVADEPVDGS
ncbi:MAG: hypothetical protein PVG53_06030 [Holophagae bacterium]|jgi:hypothetical protein